MAIELKVKKEVNFDGAPGTDIKFSITPKDDNPNGYAHPLNNTYKVHIENLSSKEFAISKLRHTYPDGKEVYKDTGITIKSAERKQIEEVTLTHNNAHEVRGVAVVVEAKVKYMIEENEANNVLNISEIILKDKCNG